MADLFDICFSPLHLSIFSTIVVYPQTKVYFSHWKDLGPDSPNIRKHGYTVVKGVLDSVDLIDDLVGGLLDLSELHAFRLRIDPANFKVNFRCKITINKRLSPFSIISL